jgi:V8-like Glu-specific endopeptidase
MADNDDVGLYPPLPETIAEAAAPRGLPTAPLDERVLGPDEYSAILESICGTTDDSQNVEQYDGTLGVSVALVNARQRPAAQVQWNANLANIYTNPGNVSGVRWGSGTLITSDLFLTAGHLFDRTADGWTLPRQNGTNDVISSPEIATNMQVNFNFQFDPQGNLRTEESFAITELVEFRLGGLDFAIVRLAGNPAATYGTTRVSRTDAAVGDMLAIIGHPAGLPKRIEAGPTSGLPGSAITYDDIDTLGGNSGSGVLRADDELLVGVHTNGGCTATGGSNSGVRIGSIVGASPIVRALAGWVGAWGQLYSDNDHLEMLDLARNADGRLEVVGVNRFGGIWHTWQTAPSNGWVGGWSQLYTDNDYLKMLRVARNQDGRLEVVGVNSAGGIWHTWQTAPNGGWVGGWSQLYTDSDYLDMLDVARNADGRLEVVGVNSAGGIWHTWQTAPNGGWVGGWSQLYTDNDHLRTLRVEPNADGRLEVIGINRFGNIWHTWQTAPNGGWVGGWSELYNDNDNLDMLDVARNQDGRLEVFGVNSAGGIWHTWQTAPNGGWVGGWSQLYTDNDHLKMLRVASNQDGRLEVVGVNRFGGIWRTWQTAPNGGWAGGWSQLYTDNDYLETLDVEQNADGRLEVVGRNQQGGIWHTWQTVPNGNEV